MNTYTTRLLLGLAIMLILPTMAMAAVPPPVAGVTVVMEDDKVRVRWEPVEGQARARVYWSYISILSNEGAYDDYAISEGPGSEYLIENPPAVDTLFIAVIAENGIGEQSPFFVEEASVQLGDGPTPGDVAVTEAFSSSEESQASSVDTQDGFTPGIIGPEMFASSESTEQAVSSATTVVEQTSSAPAQDGKFHLLAAEPISPTHVILTFSYPVVLDPHDAPLAFIVTAPGGRALRLLRLEIFNEKVTLTTEMQERGTAYQVTATSVLQGMQYAAGMQTTVPLLGNGAATAMFTGHAEGKEQQSPSGSLILNVTPAVGGHFSVETSLEYLPHEDITRYDVYQSIDGGQSFIGPQQVDPQSPSIRVNGVPPGVFIMTLKPIGFDGQPRQALTASVTLGEPEIRGLSPEGTVPSGPVPSGPVPSGLPGAGAGIVTVIGMTSGWVMARRMRRSTCL